MHERRQLDHLTRSDSEGLPHTFFRRDGDTDTLAVLFPGFGYRATMPLLHFAERSLLWRGIDVLRLDLVYDTDPAFSGADPAARRSRLRQDAERAVRAALGERNYRRHVLVGKSLGTLALADLIEGTFVERHPTCIWLTPLLSNEGLRRAVLRRRPPSFFAIGTADPLYEAAALQELMDATGGRSVVVDRADHSLEIAGDLRASLEALRAYGVGLEAFLDASGFVAEGDRNG
ncbi:MAG: hypothetical protein P8Y02_05485 [Deinococcales bacterium]